MARTWRGRVFCGISLDGYLARTDSDLDWLTDPPQGIGHREVSTDHRAREWDTFFPEIDHLVMGRGTYDKVLTFDEWAYGKATVVVLSTTLETDDPRVVVVRSLGEAVALLDERGAREVYVDGGRTIQSFLAADLVDEVTVAFAPVLIGSGLPVFGDLPHDVRFRLEGSHVDSGMVCATYTVVRDAPRP